MKSFLFIIAVSFNATIYAQKTGDMVLVLKTGVWFPATILEVKDNKFKVEFADDSKTTEWVIKDQLSQLWKKGDKVQAEWRGTWYPANILDGPLNGKFMVHYEGWGNEYDEWVEPRRLRKIP